MASSPTPAGILTTVLALGLALLFAATTGGGTDVGTVVSDAFFDGIKSQNQNGNCEGRDFYTRNAFLNAANQYPDFAQGGSEDDGKREIAAFFAHVAHETGSMCHIREMDEHAMDDFCDMNFTQWPCAQGQKYYGRGPLQISWNYNYGAAGQRIGFDGLRNPDTVAKDPLVSFESALWFWMTNVHQAMPRGFGATTRVINSGECDGKAPDKVSDRVNYYKKFCQQLNVDPGNNLTC
ncbi:chitinase 5-like [Miscanthus floridulus]|uniref:chitinase 5-like n=1 Tax=Miscanthus floridulus TaxID=154761 RepID=UPI003459D4FC